ncbi:MAG: amino acid ABC transporter substrate-binding protein [Chloroflexota bacterium]
MKKRSLHLIWYWVVGSIFIMSCGALSTFVDTTAPTPQVIVVTATPEAASDVEVNLTSETLNETTNAEPTKEAGMPPPSTLIQVQARGELHCGVNADLPGFGFYDAVRDRWSGFDVDFCRVIAAAVLGDATKVKFIAVTTADGPNERFNAVRSGMVDVLIRNTTWTASRDGSGLAFGPTTFHDGQTFMVRKSLNIQTLNDLEGKRICAGEGTTSLLNLRDDFAARGIQFDLVETKGEEELYDSYRDGACDAVTSDSSQLAVERIELPEPDDHVVLGDRISREPLGPVVAEGDDQWFDIVSWAVYASMYAEELRIDNSNVDEYLIDSTDPRVRRLLGVEGTIGQQFGLPVDFGYQIIKQVGNYADIYNKNLGPDTAFAIDRGPNKAWNLGGGGVLASPPFR